MLTLQAGDYQLDVDPSRGGSIARFEWRGTPLMRATCGSSILDTGSFPLVPFSNRIENGNFSGMDGQQVHIKPNMANHPHPLHGFGWVTQWNVVSATESEAVLEHVYAPGNEWPWQYRALQTFTLTPDGFTNTLSLENQSDSRMPAGLGFHPYFPRTDDVVYKGLHKGEWQNTPEGIPVELDEKSEASDWWNGAPIGSRAVDTVYTGREGNLRIDWKDRGIGLVIEPTGNLPFTIVYTPARQDFFCVEPVSHMTNAVNSDRADSGLLWLAPSQTLTASMTIRAKAI